MQDNSLKDHEELSPARSNNAAVEKADLFDMSFMTVHETPTKDHEGSSSRPNSPTKNKSSSSSTSSNNAPTTYNNVKFHEIKGLLVLTAEKVIFQPYDEGEMVDDVTEHSTESNPYPDRSTTAAAEIAKDTDTHHHSWRWKSIAKHQISPASTNKTLLKLVAKEGGHKAVTFALPNRTELERLRKDITHRLKPYKSLTASGNGSNHSHSNGNGNGKLPSSPSTTTTDHSHSSHGLNGTAAATSSSNENTALLGGTSGTNTNSNGNSNNDRTKSSYKWMWITITIIVLVLIALKVAMTLLHTKSINKLFTSFTDTSTATATESSSSLLETNEYPGSVYYDGFYPPQQNYNHRKEEILTGNNRFGNNVRHLYFLRG